MEFQPAYTLIGLTALLSIALSAMTFAILRFAASARGAARHLRERTTETAFMATALADALTDLRAQERASAARAAASERLSGEIVESLTSGLLVAGMDGNVRILNPAGAKLLGVPEAPPAQDYRALLSNAGALTALIDECLRTRKPIIRRTVRLPERETPIHVGVTASPLFDEQGAIHGAICLFTDLSAVVELEDQLRLQDSLARLGELTAGLAHEFRNGLATIHGYARLIDPSLLTPEYRPYIEGIRQETEALGQVVTNFLNFAKPAELMLTDVDLRALVERGVDEVRSDIHARQGTIEVRGDFPVIQGDEVMLRQAFSNLLRNALEACASAAVPPRLEIEGQVDAAQKLTRLTFTDNGPGIDPALHDRVFRPFFTTKASGTGLGLALVQKIVVTHNGRVTVTPGTQGGARFHVVLPISPER
jgi:signal transduction histidine kinase